ncbi:MAG: hypothetical protein QW046_05990 [Candidatus Micrarchaeaceae archaeon]
MTTEETKEKDLIEKVVAEIKEPLNELVKTVIDAGKLDKHVEVLQKEFERLGGVDYDLFLTDNGKEVKDLVEDIKDYAHGVWNMTDILDVIFKDIVSEDGKVNVEMFKEVNNLTDIYHTLVELRTTLEKMATLYDFLCAYHNICSENDEKPEDGMRGTIRTCSADVGLILTYMIGYVVDLHRNL